MNGRATRSWLLLEETRTVGRRIRFWRIARNWSQARLVSEASEMAGIEPALSKSFLSLLEADRTQPSVRSLHGIALALGVTLDYLVTGEAGRKRQTPRIDLRPLMRRARADHAWRGRRGG